MAFDPRTSWSAFLVASGLALTVLVSLLDPAPSRGLSPWVRFVFWGLHVGFALGLLQAVQLAVARLPDGLRPGTWGQVLLSGVIGAVVFLPVALALDRLFPVAETLEEPGRIDGSEALSEFAAYAPALIVVWLALNGTRLLRLAPTVAAPEEADAPPRPAFFARVPPELGDEIVSLSAELHYLRVRTLQGETLILCPIGTAVAELDGMAGLRVHRSHWVALAHVTGIERREGRLWAVMRSGPAIPVSRANRAAFLESRPT